MTSVPFLALGTAAAELTYFFSRKKVTSQVMKATRGARYWSRVQKVLSLFRVTGTYRGFGLWWGRSAETGREGERERERERQTGEKGRNMEKERRSQEKE